MTMDILEMLSVLPLLCDIPSRSLLARAFNLVLYSSSVSSEGCFNSLIFVGSLNCVDGLPLSQ